MGRRAHRFAAMGRVLSLDLLHVFPRVILPKPEGVAEAKKKRNLRSSRDVMEKGHQNLLSGLR
jgi:hypothetical protein